MTKKKKVAIIVAVLLVLVAVVGFFVVQSIEDASFDLTQEEAEKLVNDTFDAVADDGTRKKVPAEYISEKNYITVNSVRDGESGEKILDCSVNTVDAHSAISAKYDMFLDTSLVNETNNQVKSALDFQLEFRKELVELIENAPEKTENIEISIYNVRGNSVVYTSDEAVNAVFGGILDVCDDIREKTTYISVDASGRETQKEIDTANDNIRKGLIECLNVKYSNEVPDTSTPFGQFVNKLKKDFYQNFIQFGRWRVMLRGLGNTLKITFLALIIGVVLGFFVAFVRCAHMKSVKKGALLSFVNAICQLYLTVIRGTPVVVQILIIHFVILQPMGISTFVSAVACFGINSGAYVAEIVRGGIMSVDPGQEEAGRCLGFNYAQTMWHIIMPQAFKTVLPSLANEFVVLLKETSIAFYIGVKDLMYEVNGIRSATYSAFMPLVASAIIYLILVLTFSKLVNILERRMRNSER